MSNGGKGSTRRPTDEKAYQTNWDAIFGKKEKPKEPERPPQCSHPFCACETDCKSPGNDR